MYGAAHGALAMATPGDTSMATEAEVRKLAAWSALTAGRAGDGEKGDVPQVGIDPRAHPRTG